MFLGLKFKRSWIFRFSPYWPVCLVYRFNLQFVWFLDDLIESHFKEVNRTKKLVGRQSDRLNR